MHKSEEELWRRFQQYYTAIPSLGLALDLSRMNFPDDIFRRRLRVARGFCRDGGIGEGRTFNNLRTGLPNFFVSFILFTEAHGRRCMRNGRESVYVNVNGWISPPPYACSLRCFESDFTQP